MFQSFKDWLSSKLSPEWRKWWKLRSIQLGVLFTAGITYLSANPNAWTDFVASLPKPIADTIPAWVGTAAAGAIFLARFWKQNSPDLKRAAQDPTLENVVVAADDVKKVVDDHTV